MKLLIIVALLCTLAALAALAATRIIPSHTLKPHTSRPQNHHVRATRILKPRDDTTVSQNCNSTDDPVVEYPAASKDTKVIYKNGQKKCEHFSPTAGHTWGPCDTENDIPKHDFRENLPEQWCGPDKLCEKPSWIANRKKVNEKEKKPPA